MDGDRWVENDEWESKRRENRVWVFLFYQEKSHFLELFGKIIHFALVKPHLEAIVALLPAENELRKDLPGVELERRGCELGWQSPEETERGHRIAKKREVAFETTSCRFVDEQVTIRQVQQAIVVNAVLEKERHVVDVGV